VDRFRWEVDDRFELRFGGRVRDEPEEFANQLILSHFVEVYFFFLELQQRLVSLDLERVDGGVNTEASTV